MKQVINWEILAWAIEEAEEEHEEGNDSWYDKLEGDTAYNKLKFWRSGCLKTMEVTERSEKWWDQELTEQLKTTRRARREKIGYGLTQADRVKRWKTEKDVMRSMVREKKKECWDSFCEENGDKDSWEIVKWAKDPWHLRASMGDLTDINRVNIDTTVAKVKGIVRDYLGWREDGRRIGGEREKGDAAGRHT